MFRSETQGKKGSALLLLIMATGIFLVLGVIILKMVYNTHATVVASLTREEAFWLAEAGLEKAKVALVHNPNWYTDLPHYPFDDRAWLKEEAVGEKENLGGGWFKIVRERERPFLYAVGCQKKAVVIIKLTFSTAPFKSTKWEEL